MDNDDAPVGRILGRREALTLFGAAGMAALVACTTRDAGTPAGGTGGTGTPSATLAPSGTAAGMPSATAGATGSGAAGTSSVAAPACIVRPAMTEGPYFVDENLNRSDIRANTAGGVVSGGVPLDLVFNVGRMGAGTCDALPGAMVDVWQCDAVGVYSDVSDPINGSSKGKNFLRGFQVTDNSGIARFTTVYPGWYRGRTVHIHFKIRARDAAGKLQEFTSQLFFDDALSDEVFKQAPYNTKGARDTRNDRDGIFRSGGSQLLLQPSKTANGYAANFAIGLQIA